MERKLISSKQWPKRNQLHKKQHSPLHNGDTYIFKTQRENSHASKNLTQTTLSIQKGSKPTDQFQKVWGHYPDPINPDETFRILLNNPRGLKLGKSIKGTLHSFSVIEKLEVGTLCIPEANVNWPHTGSYPKLTQMTRKIWKNHSIVTSQIRENFESENQPGGTVTIVTNKWTSWIIEKGVDPFGLGRWTFYVFRGKGSI
jgi:hypothetical protein